MNLTELVRYEKDCLEFDASHMRSARHIIQGEKWQGFELEPSSKPQFRLKDVLRLRPFSRRPSRFGWSLSTLPAENGGAPLLAPLSVSLERADSREVVWRGVISALADNLASLTVEWPELETGSSLDLVIHLPEAAGAPAFLAVSRLLPRAEFIARISGSGVEIGPGMSPQIFPSDQTRVLYVDEMTKEQWQETYAYKKDKWEEASKTVDWSLFRSGGALDLPVEDESLDFIFGSHVFEHLVNPLQYVSNWLTKLKAGGTAYMIIPNADASLDFQQQPSTLAQAEEEFRLHKMEPEYSHYLAIFGERKAKRAMEEKRSLHVHFYNPRNLDELLNHARSEFGFSAYKIYAQENYRELFFTLTK